MVEGMGLQPWPAQYDVQGQKLTALVERVRVLQSDFFRMGQVRYYDHQQF